MTNLNDRDNYDSENRQETYTDANGETHTHVRRTTETVNNVVNPNSYGSGYVNGRYTEQRYQQANLAERDDYNVANGFLLGIILTSLVGFAIGVFWIFNHRNNADINNTSPVVVPVPVPNNASSSPTASQSPPNRTTIIEKVREVPVAVPQPQAPKTPTPAQPNINITIPPAPSATEKAPTSSQQPKTNSSAQDSSSDSLTNTPTQQKNSEASEASPSSGVDNLNSNFGKDYSFPKNNNTENSAQ